MKKTKLYILIFLLSFNTLFSQINPKNIEIVRDQYGVPHIFGKTDAEVAYGLAWAHSEDDFKTIQQAYLAGNGLLSKHLGLNGAAADFLSQLIRSDYVIDSLFNTLDPNFIKIAEGYAQGITRSSSKSSVCWCNPSLPVGVRPILTSLRQATNFEHFSSKTAK